MTTDTRPLILVVATGMRHYREYLLRSIGTEYRVRHINEQHWNSSFHTDRWVYAHERCYQAYLTSFGAVS